MRVPRRLQIGIPGVFHKMWKGHNREHVLDHSSEKGSYLQFLGDAFSQKIKKHVQWHAYCLMGNHTHEVDRVLPNKKGSLKKSIDNFSAWMRNAHSRYGIWYNTRHGRQGKVAYDRPKTEPIKNEWEVLKVMFYCDANPVRAGLVSHPSQYRFSSYRYYAYGENCHQSEHLVPPDAYLALGRTAKARQKKYRQLCDLYLRQEGLIEDSPSGEVSGNEELVRASIEFHQQLYEIHIRGAP